MNILVDENIPRITVEHLLELGHEVRDLRGTVEQGLGDSGLWSAAQADNRMLITTDRGFAAFRTVAHYGVLIVRLRQPNLTRYTTRLCSRSRVSRKENGLVFSWLCATQPSASLGRAVRWSGGTQSRPSQLISSSPGKSPSKATLPSVSVPRAGFVVYFSP
jgi:predicted nuclease of predicted toxin-antitoxin system